MKDAEEARLLSLLDASHKWPSIYPFKFIVPVAKAKELEAMMKDAERTETRPSAEGRYMAYTFHCAMGSAREVLEVYAKVKGITGLVSL